MERVNDAYNSASGVLEIMIRPCIAPRGAPVRGHHGPHVVPRGSAARPTHSSLPQRTDALRRSIVITPSPKNKEYREYNCHQCWSGISTVWSNKKTRPEGPCPCEQEDNIADSREQLPLTIDKSATADWVQERVRLLKRP